LVKAFLFKYGFNYKHFWCFGEVFVGLETIPMLYEQYEEELTYAASKSGRDMKKLLNKFNSKVINKIPKAQAKTRRTM